jgi:UDP:flavonoid glycosyltransferase YjiC (YdhE family)
MSALLDQLDEGRIDGIIWAGLAHHVSLHEDSNPAMEWNLKTKRIRAPLLEHEVVKDIFAPAWASQFSILAHPSTALFVFQGGAESTNEATFHGVPLFIFPYYGDTRIVARRMKLAGVARVQERYEVSFESVREHIHDILLDVNGTIAYNVARMKTLARMGARRKSIAADLIGKTIGVFLFSG